VESGASMFETEQLNVALKSVVDKLESKGKQLQVCLRHRIPLPSLVCACKVDTSEHGE
jgi:hypothetical protein